MVGSRVYRKRRVPYHATGHRNGVGYKILQQPPPALPDPMATRGFVAYFAMLWVLEPGKERSENCGCRETVGP